METNTSNGFKNQLILTPLEMCDISNEIIDDVIDSLEIDFTKYIYEFLVYPIDLESDINIGNILESKLDDKYYSVRGEKKKLELLYNNIKTFYKTYELFDLSKERLSKIYKGKEINIFNILELAFYEGISINELCEGVDEVKDRQLILDEKVKYLLHKGYNYSQIGKIMKVGHQVIKNIISGIYS